MSFVKRIVGPDEKLLGILSFWSKEPLCKNGGGFSSFSIHTKNNRMQGWSYNDIAITVSIVCAPRKSAL